MNSKPVDNRTSPAPPTVDARAAGAGRFGMVIFLISLSILFAASIIGYLVVRLRAESWRTTQMPELPSGLWVSTALLIACSGVLHFALVRIRKNSAAASQRALLAGLVLGAAFLVNQILNWLSLASTQLPPTARNLYAFTFYMLTGLHAAHVIGGLIQLGVVAFRAFHGRYTAAYHPGITYTVMYWHFLDTVWLVMFLVMLALT